MPYRSDTESMVARDRHGLVVLSPDECMHLLASAHVGRLGFTDKALPVILPVNFLVDGGVAVFCTEPGAKLDAARQGQIACIEVDDYDPVAHTGWSVLATGRLRELTDSDDLARARRLPVRPWGLAAPDHYVTLALELVSGRSVGGNGSAVPRT